MARFGTLAHALAKLGVEFFFQLGNFDQLFRSEQRLDVLLKVQPGDRHFGVHVGLGADQPLGRRTNQRQNNRTRNK